MDAPTPALDADDAAPQAPQQVVVVACDACAVCEACAHEASEAQHEAAAVPRRRRAALVLVFLAVLLGDTNRGLVLPTLILRLHGNAKAVGVANAGFSALRLAAAPFFGHWQDRRCSGEVLVLTSVVGLVANAAYAVARTDAGVVAARCVLGIGSCVLGVGRAVVAKTTSTEERTPMLSLLSAVRAAAAAC
jgi:MFS family permease